MSAPRKHDREALVPVICARLATGEPMTVVCRDIGVPVKTVNDWRLQDEGIREQFHAARDDGYDAIAHRTRATARGKGESKGGDSTGDVQRDKLIIDTDLKLLAKWDPRRYGDKVQLANGDGTNLPAPQFIIQPVATKAAE
ncbi:hypothetical protein RHOFW510R12_01465 [Rhodanobacter sp. FW510-R12]|uniref:terminase small subunit-like protein n=1 Tax=unclassified Rhodanobacter TaxID=2621553 RepID=UPI0007AA0CFF|nr:MULTISPECIES: hypothetical protein [unclassified Rhodanobacter]KZC17026.1 hypothetical protein RHOFW104R8_13375 [Rhodanobacter sp. FW104-R8]KZC28550.1 hypothetical protein RhoFW510T8_10615 [Rhodanobacter sp. FW510-T8]KZC32347.1 hypothetical protein RhoFW510R10_13010 [Rhodanobacter sp. FW510-R10]